MRLNVICFDYLHYKIIVVFYKRFGKSGRIEVRCLFRNIMNDLATWFETEADKIAVVRGGKFVGKTWAVTDFAMGFFEDHVIIDMNRYVDFAV